MYYKINGYVMLKEHYNKRKKHYKCALYQINNFHKLIKY